MHFSRISALATLASTVSAYSATGRTFAVNHFYGKGPLVQARMDPIINPGVASGHVHAVQGGNAFGLTMTDNQALTSTCTSSLVKNDKSNYWTPSLYFKDPKTGQLEDVEMFYMNVYYFFEATTDKIEAFPPGLRMVVGNPSLRTPPATGGKSILDLSNGTPQPVQWTCPRSNTNDPLYPTNSDGLHGVGIQDPGNKGAGVGFPDQNCDGYASPLRADIHFPSCYNPAAGLDDYKNNMQFPTNGNCPSGWIHTPHLFYEVYWNTPKFASRWTQGQGNQPFVLSNGDPTGYGLHGDFFAGWDTATLQQIIDHCDAGDSGMDKCPGLIGGLNDPSTSCNIVSPINEAVTGTMAALPGNNPIGSWGTNAVGAAPASSAASTAKAATSAAAVQTTAPKATTTAAAVVSNSNPKSSSSASVPLNVVQTVSVAPVKATSSASGPVVSAPAVSDKGKGATTLVTSLVSTTTMVYTTVTANGPAPTATGKTSTGSQPTVDGWSYYGCYADSRNRVLSGITFANVGNHAVSNTKCVAYCEAHGYSMAGTEYGGQCFCDNKLTGSSALDASNCSMPCEGDSTQTCGGGMALTVYTKTANKERRVNSRHLHRHLHSHA